MVSVVIPTYNRAELLPRAVGSVLAQTYSRFEVIVVDDASSDGTEAAVKGMADERIRYIRHEENRGAPAARNTGIRAARGEFVAFQDSDDEWLPGKLEKQMRAFAGAPPEVGVVYTGFWKIGNGERTYVPPEHVQKEGDILRDLLKENFVSTQCLLARKECLESVGLFDESMPRLQDWELVIRLAKRYRFRCIDEPLVNAYYQRDSISAKSDALLEAHLMILRKHKDIYKQKHLRLFAKHLYGFGTHFYRHGDAARGKALINEAIRIWPLSPARWPTFLIINALGRTAYLKLYAALRNNTEKN